MTTLLEFKHVSKQYGSETRALSDVNFAVKEGEFVSIIGPSGAGKSTLLRCINRMIDASSGEIVFDNASVLQLNKNELKKLRTRIGMIFQHYNLVNRLSVIENVLHGRLGYKSMLAGVLGIYSKEEKAQAYRLLQVLGLQEQVYKRCDQLSGGQKQRVGIARALAAEPAVLLSDEATSALDPETTQSILALLRDLNQRLGLTILLITHEMGVVKEICHRVAVLEAGRIVESGTVAELASRPGSHLATTLFPRPALNGNRPDGLLATLMFVGAAADAPVMTTLVRQFSVDVNVLSGSIELVQGERIGQLQVALSGDRIDEALEWLRGQGLGVEVH